MADFKYKHIIWDWNGTLFDDAWLCVDIINGMLARRDLPSLTPARYETIFDFPVIDYYRLAGFDFSLETFELLSNEFIAAYKHRTHECRLRAGAAQALESAQKSGLSQSILSAMEQNHLDQLVHSFGLATCFNGIVGLQDHHAFGKTETALRWLAEQHLPKDKILFVGDTLHDHEVAEALGVDSCLIYSGHHARSRLQTRGVKVVDSLSDVLEFTNGRL